MIEIKPKEKESRLNSNPALRFVWAYLFALLLTALIFTLSYIFAIHMLQQEVQYSALLKATNQFNLLSQTITKTSLQVRLCTEQKKCEQQLQQLSLTLKKWEWAFKELTHYQFANNRNDTIKHLVDKSKNYYYPMLRATNKILSYRSKVYSFKGTKSIIRATQMIEVNEKYLTLTLNHITEQYYQEASQNIQQLKRVELLLLISALILLLLEAIFIFQPVVNKAKWYFEHFQKANKALAFEHEQLTEAFQKIKLKEEQTRRDAQIITENNKALLAAKNELMTLHEEISRKNEHLQKALTEIHNNKRLEEIRFFDISISEFNKIMRWESQETVDSWSARLLTHLVPYIKGFQAVIYVHDTEKNTLTAVGSYAVAHDLMLHKHAIPMGETHIGQVAKSRKMVYFKDLNLQPTQALDKVDSPNQLTELAPQVATYTATISLLPTTLLILPLMYYDTLVGVLEVNALAPFSDKHLELVKRLTDTIAANLHTLNDQKHINQLFADSQLAEKRLRKSLIRLQENEERFRKMAEVTQEGLAFLQDNTLIDANPTLVKMMGYVNSMEMIGMNYIELIAPAYRFELEDKKIIQEEVSHETVGFKKDATEFPIEMQARKVRYKDEQITVISIRDITLRKQTEEELAEANRIASLVKVIEKKNKDIMSSIEYAQRIQEAILPSNKLLGKGFLEHFVLYKPKDIVSGDFYWYAEKNEHALIAAVDCTGHGVPGAFMSLIGYSQLNKIVIEQGIVAPHEVLTRLDEGVSESLNQKDDNSRSRDGMDIALCSLNIYEKKLSFAGAYRPMYLIRDGELTEFKADSFPIGGNFKYKKEKKFTPNEVKLQARDTIYIFTDGFPDQFGGTDNRKYMTKNFKNLLLRIQDYNMDEQRELIQREFLQWKGDHKQMDDILVIGLRF